MAQFLRPSSDITTTNVSAGTWDSIDESTASDADFVIGTNNLTTTYETLLSGLTGDPESGTCTVRFRHAQGDHDTSPFAPATVGTAWTTVTCEVYQGTTQVAADSAQTNSGSWVARSFTFSTSAVSNWSNLRLRFTITGAGGATANRRTGAISWAEIETPNPATVGTGSLPTVTCTAPTGSVTSTATISALVGTVTTTAPSASAAETYPAYDVSALVDFADPTANLTGDQEFRVLVRKSALHAGATGTPTVDVELWLSGSQVSVLVSGVAVTSDTGQVVTATWAASLVTATDPTGQNVQCKIVGHVGGTGANARTIDIGAVEWYAQTEESSGVTASGLLATVAVTALIGSAEGTTPSAFDRRVFPNVIISQSGLTGSIAALTETVDSPDGNWLLVA